MSLLARLSGFSLQTKALLIISVFIIGFGSGYKVCGAFKSASQSASIKRQLKTADTMHTDTKKQVKQLQTTLVETKIVYRTIKEKIHAENDTRICFADNIALQLWNDAIAGQDTPRPSVAGKAAEPYAIVATVEEVLTNASDNFETCNSNSLKHNALIDKVESLDGKMCVCAE